MDKLESLGPYAHLSSEYRAFCESKVNLVKKCIDLAGLVENLF